MNRALTRALLLASASYASVAHAEDPQPNAPPSPPSETPAPSPAEPAPAEPPPAPAEPPAAEAPTPTPEPAPAPPPESLAPFPTTGAPPAAPPPPTATFAPGPEQQAAPRPRTPPPAAAATAATGRPSDDKAQADKPKDDQSGLLGPFRIGPVIGVGLPSLINVGGVIKITPYFAAGINIGIAPSVKFAYYGEATVSYHAYQLYGHLHPFGGGFYLGASVGYALAQATDEQVIGLPAAVRAIYPSLGSSVTLKSEGSVQTMVLTPELGYFYTFKVGFSIGLGAGLQIPIAASDVHFDQGVNADVPQEVLKQYLDPTARAVQDSLERIGQTVIPTLGLSVGWLL